MIVRSVRRQALRTLRERQRAAATAKVSAPWSRWWSQPRPGRRLAAEFVLGLAVVCASVFCAPSSWGTSTATTGFLAVLWQVQAASVSLTLALAVFVFGLLPQTRGRVTYPAFLSRSWAVEIVVFGVVSMLLNGFVLLGAGHQVTATRSSASDGHGWAVTVAVVIAMGSIATIALLFGKTISAIDPATATRTDARYRRQAVGLAVRDELFQRTSIEAVQQFGHNLTALAGSPRTGRAVYTRRSRDAVVHDISTFRLRLLSRYLAQRKMSPPTVLVWPGRVIRGRATLMTIDEKAGPVTRWCARHCFQVRAAPADTLTPVLEALQGEILEHIRADRPVDAKDYLNTLVDLLKSCWHAYASSGMEYDENVARGMPIWFNPVIPRITSALFALLRAAAISRDEQIRLAAVRLPHNVAREAIEAGASASIPVLLELHEGIYNAIIDDLTDSGRLALPVRGAGRGRINRLFSAMFSFPHHDVTTLVERVGSMKYRDAAPGEKEEILRTAQLATAHMDVANETILALLRRTIEVDDIGTLCLALPMWAIPSTTFATSIGQADESRVESARPGASSAGHEFGEREQQLIQSWAQARVALDAMRLRLLGTAIAAENRATPELNSPPIVLGAPAPVRVAGLKKRTAAPKIPTPRDPDQAVAAILKHLRPGRLWQGVALAVTQTESDEAYRATAEDEINPMGVVFLNNANQTDRLLEVFLHAAIVRPELTADRPADPRFARTHAQAISRIALEIADRRQAWFTRYGIDPATAKHRAEMIKTSITKAAEDGRRTDELETLAASLPPDAKRRVESDARAKFAARDILSRLLQWAGKPAEEATSAEQPLEKLAAWNAGWRRDILLDVLARPTESSMLADEAAKGLATELLKALLHEVPEDSTQSPVPQSKAAAVIKAAITSLRSARRSIANLPTSASGICVLIPNNWSLAQDLELSATRRDSGATRQGPQERTDMLTALTFDDPETGWHLAGLIDDVPVIRLDTDMARIVIVDLSRFASMQLAHDTSNSPGSPRLVFIENTEASVRTVSEQAIAEALASTDPELRKRASAENVLDNEIRTRMLVVPIRFVIDGKITVDAPAAALSVALAADGSTSP
jgi:hypothetical protein